MKKLVAAALTAVTAAIAGSAIALTPAYAQEIPPESTAEPTAAPAQPQAPASGASGSNIVVFVVPESVGELTNAACSVDEVAEKSRSRSMMRVGSRDRASGGPAWTAADSRRHDNDESNAAEDTIGLPSEACTTLQGLFASLTGIVPNLPVTNGATDVAVDDDAEDAGNDEGANATSGSEEEETAPSTEDDDVSDDADDTEGTLKPTGRTSVYVTIFAGSDAGEDGCTLDELIAASSGSVPVVEAGGEVPLQGAADVSDIALPADVCALLSTLFGTAATTPTTPAGSAAPSGDDTPADDATTTPDTETDEADDADETDDADDEAEDGTSTPAAGSATTTPSSNGTTTPSSNGTTTPSGNTTATPTGTTAAPTATSTPDAGDSDDDEESSENADEP